MLGFSETEVRKMIRYYQSVGALKADENALIAEMNRGMIFRTRQAVFYGTNPQVLYICHDKLVDYGNCKTEQRRAYAGSGTRYFRGDRPG